MRFKRVTMSVINEDENGGFYATYEYLFGTKKDQRIMPKQKCV